MAADLTDIRKNLKSKKLVIGTKEIIKNLKLGKLEKVFVTSNCPQQVKHDVSYYSSLSGCEFSQLEIPNEELGIVCKKQFAISVAGLMK